MSIGRLDWQNPALNQYVVIEGWSNKLIFIYQHAYIEVWNELPTTIHLNWGIIALSPGSLIFSMFHEKKSNIFSMQHLKSWE